MSLPASRGRDAPAGGVYREKRMDKASNEVSARIVALSDGKYSVVLSGGGRTETCNECSWTEAQRLMAQAWPVPAGSASSMDTGVQAAAGEPLDPLVRKLQAAAKITPASNEAGDQKRYVVNQVGGAPILGGLAGPFGAVPAADTSALFQAATAPADPSACELSMDQHVKLVAEFMRAHVPAAKLVNVAQALAELAPILWGKYEREEVRALALMPQSVASAARFGDEASFTAQVPATEAKAPGAR